MHLIVEYCGGKDREWLPPVSWKVESIEHDTVTKGAEEDFIWFAASDELPDLVTDVLGRREYGSCLDTTLRLGNSSRSVNVVR